MSRLCTWKACCGSSVSGVHAPPVFWVGPHRLSLAEMQWKKETHFKKCWSAALLKQPTESHRLCGIMSHIYDSF